MVVYGYSLCLLMPWLHRLFFGSSYLEQSIPVKPLIVEISGQLPSFFHTYAFILLTFIVLGASSRINLYLSISLWVFIEVLFEIGQHNLLSPSMINLIPGRFEGIPVFDITDKYFMYGTFDPLDLLAITIAPVFALLTVHLVQLKGGHHG